MLQEQNSLKKQARIYIWVSTVKIQWALPETAGTVVFLLSLMATCECPSGSQSDTDEKGSAAPSSQHSTVFQILSDYSLFPDTKSANNHLAHCNCFLDFPLFGQLQGECQQSSVCFKAQEGTVISEIYTRVYYRWNLFNIIKVLLWGKKRYEYRLTRLTMLVIREDEFWVMNIH